LSKNPPEIDRWGTIRMIFSIRVPRVRCAPGEWPTVAAGDAGQDGEAARQVAMTSIAGVATPCSSRNGVHRGVQIPARNLHADASRNRRGFAMVGVDGDNDSASFQAAEVDRIPIASR